MNIHQNLLENSTNTANSSFISEKQTDSEDSRRQSLGSLQSLRIEHPAQQEQNIPILEFNPFQTPPDLKIAQKHYRTTGFGPINTLEENCPCCGQPEKKSLSVFQPIPKSKSIGSTVPLYLQFSLFYLAMTVILGYGYFQYGWDLRTLYCEYLVQQRGIETTCSLFDFNTYGYYSNDFLTSSGEKIYLKFSGNFINILVAQVIVSFIPLVFGIRQFRLIQKLQNVQSAKIENFTVMVEKVKVEDSFRDLQAFFNDLMIYINLTPVVIKQISLGTYEGNVCLFQKRAKELNTEIQGLIRYMSTLDLGKDETKRNALQNVISKRQKDFNKFQKLQNQWLTRRRVLRTSRENCVAFITVESNYQKDLIVHAYNKKFKNSPLTNIFCCCFLKTPRYRISEAPNPTGVLWTHIGYSDGHRTASSVATTLTSILVIPLFVAALFLVKVALIYTTPFESDSLVIAFISFLAIRKFGFLSNRIFDWLFDFENSVTSAQFMVKKAVRNGFLQYVLFASTFFVKFAVVKHKPDVGVEGRAHAVMYGFWFVLMTALFCPLLSWFPIGWVLKACKRRKLAKQDKEFKENLSTEAKPIEMTQLELHQLFSRSESDIEAMYSAKVVNLLIILSLSHTTPLVMVVGASYFLFDFFAEKYAILNYYKPPRNRIEALPMQMLEATFLIIKLNIAMFLFEIINTASNSNQNGIADILPIIGMCFCCFYLLIPLSWVNRGILSRMRERYMKNNVKELVYLRDFSDEFETDYEKENPAGVVSGRQQAGRGEDREVEGDQRNRELLVQGEDGSEHNGAGLGDFGDGPLVEADISFSSQ